MCNVRQYNDYLITKLTANLRGRGVNICAWTHDIVIYCSWALPFSFMMCVQDHKRVYLLTISPSVCSSSRPTTTSNHCCCLMENPHAGPGSMPAPCQRRQLSISTTVPQDWAYQLGSLEDLVKGTAWLKPLEDGWSLWFSTTWVSTLLTPKQAVLNAAVLLSIKGSTQLHMTSFGGIRDLKTWFMWITSFKKKRYLWVHKTWQQNESWCSPFNTSYNQLLTVSIFRVPRVFTNGSNDLYVSNNSLNTNIGCCHRHDDYWPR